MIIEFIGIPGAGKTTIADQLMVEMRSRGLLDQIERDEESRGGAILWWAGYFRETWARRKIVWRSLRLLRVSKRKRKFKNFSLRRLIFSLRRQRLAKRSPDKVFIFQEGYLQQLHTVLVDGPKQPDFDLVRQMVHAGAEADIVAYIEIEPEVAYERLQKRVLEGLGGIPGRFNHLPESEQLETLRSGAALFDRIASELTENPQLNCSVVRVPGDSSGDALAGLTRLILDGGQQSKGQAG